MGTSLALPPPARAGVRSKRGEQFKSLHLGPSAVGPDDRSNQILAGVGDSTGAGVGTLLTTSSMDSTNPRWRARAR
jgi:hypothetical protein